MRGNHGGSGAPIKSARQRQGRMALLWLALIFCFAGMTLFFFGKLDMSNIQGNLFAIGSGICFALFSLFLKWKKQIHKTESTINALRKQNAELSAAAKAAEK